MRIRTYTELSRLPSFEERFDYLKLYGMVGSSTFGYDRYLNQNFYHSKEWRSVRDFVITRDEGCDLGDPEHLLAGGVIIHHINPITIKDISESTEFLLDPEFLITTCDRTHKAIHFGDKDLLPKPMAERRPGDTCPWK